MRGHNRYQYVEATAEYHQIANPMISPIKGTQMRLPNTMENTRKIAQTCGPLFRHMHPVVPDNGWYNMVAAFRKRCNYFSAKRATPKIIAASREFAEKLCPVPLPCFEWNEHNYREWLIKFGPEKQARMNQALLTLPFSTLSDYTSKDIFMKVEALLVTHKPNWAGRVIYKSTDLYNAISGPIFSEMMRRFDACLERMGGPYHFRTAYRKTPDQYTGHVEIEHDDEFIVEADFSSNDKFQCADVILLECALMRLLGAPEWFVRLHMKSDKFQVTDSKHGVRATLQHQFPTGATDTTFRNTFWNGTILWAFLREVKASSCNAILLGDDMLAKVRGRVRHVTKIYSNIATEAHMEVKAKRHANLWTATFVSKFFIPHGNAMHLTVPILGKALARFNMRANQNSAVTDHAYMAGKAISYAYEFRFYPTIRNIFLERFDYEFKEAKKEKRGVLHLEVHSWNAREAGVTLSNITKKLVTEEYLDDAEFTAFCIERYALMGMEVLDLFRQVVLSDLKHDLEGVVVEKLAQDFL